MFKGLSKIYHNIRQQEQIRSEKDFSRALPGKYMAKLIYGWGNTKYKREREKHWWLRMLEEINVFFCVMSLFTCT